MNSIVVSEIISSKSLNRLLQFVVISKKITYPLLCKIASVVKEIIMNNEINLLEVSSVTQKKRRRPFKSDTSDVICLETNPSSQKGPERKRGDAGAI